VIVGVPKEIAQGERRVALVPDAVKALVSDAVQIVVEAGCGLAAGYDDAAWPTGPAGFGYSDGDDATELSGMSGSYVTLYTRRSFQLADASVVDNLALRVSYDDGFVAYLNGVEVARSNVPFSQDHATTASGSHEAVGFEIFDLTGQLGLLQDGTNVLAVEGHNESLGSGDFSLHPVLEIVGVSPTGENSPDAVLLSDVSTANAPATVRFDASLSSDADGAVTSYLLDFGDGSAPVASPVATHLYSAPGLYVASLIATDDSGLQAVDEVAIHVHAAGKAPKTIADVDDAYPEAGATVAFDASASSDPDGGPLLYHWFFDDPASGSANFAVGPTATHAFASAGTYEVNLLVTDDEGSQISTVLEISVDGEPPPPGGGGGGGGGGCSTTGIDPRSGGDTSFAVVLAALAAFLLWNARRTRTQPVAGR